MAESNKDQQENQINVQLPEEVAEGIYSNLAIITHSQSEFVIDFVRIMPNVPQAKVKSRVILSPSHAKRLLRALEENLNKYEKMHRTIDDNDGSGFSGFPMNFGGPTAEA